MVAKGLLRPDLSGLATTILICHAECSEASKCNSMFVAASFGLDWLGLFYLILSKMG